MRTVTKVLVTIGILICATPAAAEDCATVSCPTGQTVVSFGDGNNVQCACVEAGTGMEPTNEIPDGCVDSDDNGVCD